LNNQDKVYCCYGSITVNNNDGYCCVHDSVMPFDAGNGGDIIGGDVMDSCFPFCSTMASHIQKRVSLSQQCIDKVPVTASDYSERVSAASKSAAVSQTASSQPSSNSASATELVGASATAASSSGSGGSSSGPTTSPTKNAAPVTTRGAVYVGGIMAAVVMLIV
jgi:hypothetical protein